MHLVKSIFKKIKVIREVQKAYNDWYFYLFDYLIDKLKTGSINKYVSSGKLKLRYLTFGDLWIFRDIWVNKVYTPDASWITDNSVVIDIGAHMGIFSIFATTRGKNIKVYAYEPNPQIFDILQENINRANLTANIKISKKAVWGKKCVKKLFIDSKNTGGHSFIDKSKAFTMVNCTTLKDILDSENISKCDFLKMDCEGSEYEILFNLPRNYFKRIKVLSIEFHDINKKYNSNKLEEFLKKNGFATWRHKTLGILYGKKT